jgi:lysophospholipase L1-like esterase
VRKIVVYSVMATGCIALLLCLIGLVMTLSGSAGKGVETSPMNNAEQPVNAIQDEGFLSVLALGDSLTTGAGDESETGYVGHVTDGLQQVGTRQVKLNNRAVNGFVAEQLLQQLTEAETEDLVRKADLILLSIGGNDLYRGGETLASLDESLIRSIEQNFQTVFKKILARIRTANPNAPIAMIGLYNPFNQLDRGEQTNEVVRRWNENVSNMLASDAHALLVPTYDLYDANANVYLADDNFHPNGAGYEMIATRVLQTLPVALNGGANNE